MRERPFHARRRAADHHQPAPLGVRPLSPRMLAFAFVWLYLSYSACANTLWASASLTSTRLLTTCLFVISPTGFNLLIILIGLEFDACCRQEQYLAGAPHFVAPALSDVLIMSVQL